MVMLIALAFVVRCVWLDRSVGFGRGVLEAFSLIGVMGVVAYGLGYTDWQSVVGVMAPADAGHSASVNLAGPLDPAGRIFLPVWRCPG